MEVKLQKAEWANILRERAGDTARVGNTYLMVKVKRETAKHITLTNASTADIDVLEAVNPNGIEVRGFRQRSFVPVSSPLWRG